MTIKTDLRSDLNKSISIAQTSNTPNLVNLNHLTNPTAEMSGSEIAPQNYLKAKLTACYAELPTIDRLLSVAAAAYDAVSLGFRQPLTIPKSLVAADNALEQWTKAEKLVLSAIVYSIWYTATSLTDIAISLVLTDKIQSAQQIWYAAITTRFSIIVDLVFFVIAFFLAFVILVATVKTGTCWVKDALHSPRSCVRQHRVGVVVPLTGGHFKKPPGASYVERTATNSITTRNQHHIPITHTLFSLTPKNDTTRERNGSICGKPASHCRDQCRQFNELLKCDEAEDNKRRQELAAAVRSDNSKSREIERLNIELEQTTEMWNAELEKKSQELENTILANTELNSKLEAVTEELSFLEELTGPDSQEMFNKLNEELTAAKQQIELEKTKQQIILNDSAAYRERLEVDIELCQQAESKINKDLKRKLLIAQSEALQAFSLRQELDEWKRKHSNVSEAHHHAMKRCEDAEKRREDCYVRMEKAESKVKELKEKLRAKM